MKELYTTYRSYLKKKFGKPVLKIPLNAGFSCPNRDGTKSSKGCSFCDNRSFSPVALESSSVTEQLHTAIDRASTKFDMFIAYLQPFTNTYGSVEQLRSLYEPLINIPGVIGLSIGTRPDCLSNEICKYLIDLSKRTSLSIEIGLQSAYDKILMLNNRGHTFHDFKKAVERLSTGNIDIVAHVMLGLPGDTRDTMLYTAKKLAAMTVNGVKIHQLMIIKDTDLELQYNSDQCTPLTLIEYANLVSAFISHLRPNQQIHRIMADSKPEYGLIAPLWSAKKMSSLAYIRKYMEDNNIFQGCEYKRTG